LSVDPDNQMLKDRAAEVVSKRAQGQPTVPSLLSEEMATNPFLRASDSGMRAYLGLAEATDAEVFAEVRTRKDNF
ncbi:MAG: hydroxyacylglutathione hydrolase C-terminal domain-containing protein, partial [Candidatus Puniceispirillaceae bacterium]